MMDSYHELANVHEAFPLKKVSSIITLSFDMNTCVVVTQMQSHILFFFDLKKKKLKVRLFIVFKNYFLF